MLLLVVDSHWTELAASASDAAAAVDRDTVLSRAVVDWSQRRNRKVLRRHAGRMIKAFMHVSGLNLNIS